MSAERPLKRASGGGRKPQGGLTGKVETFTTRITAETKFALEQAAAQSGRSVSSEAEHRLRNSLHKPSGAMASHNVALAHAIALLAERIERETKGNWRRDSFTGLG